MSPARSLPAPFAARLRGAVSMLALPAEGTELLRFAPSSPAGAVLLLVHGGGNDRLYGFWSLIEGALAAGLGVATMHLPGHGSGTSDVFGLEAARRRLDAAVAAVGPGPLVLLGQSLGGALVLDHLARGGGATAYVAVSAPLELALDVRVVRELGALFRAPAWRTLDYVPWAEALPAVGPFGRERMPVRMPAGVSYLEGFRRTIAALDLESRLAQLARPSGPVLLAHGVRDGVVPFDHARRLAAALGPRATLLPIAGAGHFDPLLRRSVVRELVGWVGSRASASSGPRR